MRSKLWYIVTLVAFALLPLAGCSGTNSSTTKATEKGVEVTVSGKVDAKTAGKSVFLSATSAGAPNNVFVYNALDGAQLGFAAIGSDGSFSNLAFTLPTTKTVLVFKAIVTQGTFRTVVPIDLSNAPAAGAVTTSNPINIVISQASTDITSITSSMLGLTGLLGDTGKTLASVSKTYTDASKIVVDFGGQQLSYSAAGGSALALSGKFSSAALLPAQDANILTVDQLNNMTLNGSISSVFIPGANPIVNFQVTNAQTGKGIRGLKAFNLVIAQLKEAASGPSSEWLSYMVTATSTPTTDSGYTVIDNGDGSYTAKFGKDIKTTTGSTVTYDANLTHRLMVGVRATPTLALQQSGSTLSNFYNELLMAYTFVPATAAVIADANMPDITTTAACNECHGKIGVTTPHGGRGDVRYCMMCHTSQRAIGQTEATEVNGVFTAPIYAVSPTNSRYDANQAGKPVTTLVGGKAQGDFVTMIHKIHMGNKLTKQGYNYAGVFFNGITYPKEVTNCRQCHKDGVAAAPKGDNWRTRPSRKTCGACHDNINFATGVNAKAGGTAHVAQADDSQCLGCHGPTQTYPVESFHMTVNATVNNPSVKADLVNFFYEISSVTVNATNQPVIKFRIQQAKSPSTTKTNVVFTGTGVDKTGGAPAFNPLLTDFVSGPGFILAYYKPSVAEKFQSSSTSPDYNNIGQKAAQPLSVSIANLADGTKGSLSLPDANGFYTATLNNSATTAFPSGAVMRAVGLQGYFTQTNLPAYPYTPATQTVPAVGTGAPRHALSVVKEVTGDVVRREVVDSVKCGKCHEWFEGHGGSRVVGLGTVGQSICTLCHVPNLSTSGRGANAELMTFILTNTVGTSLAAIIDPTSTKTTPDNVYSGFVTQEAKDAISALIAVFGSDPYLYPEASNNFKDMIHGIHSGSDPLVVGTPLTFVRDRTTSGDFEYNFKEVKFPSILKNCRACHKDSFDSNGNLDNSKATYISIPAGAQVSTHETSNGTTLNASNNVTVVNSARKSLPNAQDLVSSPFTATCKACHSRPNALAHFSQNGGKLSQLRSTVKPDDESCVTCHGTTGPNALWNVHRFTVQGE